MKHQTRERHVLDPPDWRHQEAARLHESGASRPTHPDSLVIGLVRGWRAEARGATAPAHQRVLLDACRARETSLEKIVQAYVLADVHPAEIAKATGLSEEVITAYEALCWDVRHELAYPALRAMRTQPDADDPEGWLMRWVAVHVGRSALDDYLAGRISDELRGRLEGLLSGRLLMNAVHVACLPATEPNTAQEVLRQQLALETLELRRTQHTHAAKHKDEELQLKRKAPEVREREQYLARPASEVDGGEEAPPPAFAAPHLAALRPRGPSGPRRQSAA